MDYLRYSDERGKVDFGWLKSKHTFSFGEYHDPRHMGFRVLRVINQDEIEGGTGFPTHGHRDMEIVSYVFDGALEHEDTLGNKTVIKRYEVQRMSAGSGIKHSEYNHFKDKKTHFLQIWITPNKNGIAASYAQKSFEDFYKKKEKFFLVASSDGRSGSITLSQDVSIYVGLLNAGEEFEYKPMMDRHTWVQLVKGELVLNGYTLRDGDGIGLSKKEVINIQAKQNTEYLLFDLI